MCTQVQTKMKALQNSKRSYAKSTYGTLKLPPTQFSSPIAKKLARDAYQK